MNPPTHRTPGRLAPLALVASLALLAQGAAAVTLASSNFSVDADGWEVKDLPFPNPGWPPVVLGTYMPTFNASGGDLGGYLSRLDVSANV
jgi:hypothetical protein